MRRHGLREGVDVLPGGATEEDGGRAAHALLARAARERPTAVVCFNDRCAIGLRDSVLREGGSVPEALSVVGYDDSPLARMGTVDLTSVSQDPLGLAEATVAVIAALLDGDDSHACGGRRHPAAARRSLVQRAAARSTVDNTPRPP